MLRLTSSGDVLLAGVLVWMHPLHGSNQHESAHAMVILVPNATSLALQGLGAAASQQAWECLVLSLPSCCVSLHLTHLASLLSAAGLQPESLGCFVQVAANWAYSLFFILGELWGSVAISLLFW